MGSLSSELEGAQVQLRAAQVAAAEASVATATAATAAQAAVAAELAAAHQRTTVALQQEIEVLRGQRAAADQQQQQLEQEVGGWGLLLGGGACCMPACLHAVACSPGLPFHAARMLLCSLTAGYGLQSQLPEPFHIAPGPSVLGMHLQPSCFVLQKSPLTNNNSTAP